MKKTISIICILLTAALVALFWVKIDDALTRKTHPHGYMEYVEKYAQENAVPPELVYGVIKTESDFKSDAVSDKGAVGLMQIMPDTYSWLCSKTGDENVNPDLLYVPETNIKYGTYYLSTLYTQFGNWENALAAYNAGPSRVKLWIKEYGYDERGLLKNIPFDETAKYVKKVLKEKEIYSQLYYSENNK